MARAQKHIDNLNLIKDIMTLSNMMEHFDYNTAKNVVSIWNRLPQNFKMNIYIREFCKICYNLTLSYERDIEMLKEYANRYSDFKNKYDVK